MGPGTRKGHTLVPYYKSVFQGLHTLMVQELLLYNLLLDYY